MRPVTINPHNTISALQEIMNASHENDLVEIAKNFTVTGTYVPTFVLNLSAPTAANIAAVLATILTTLQKGGLNRTT